MIDPSLCGNPCKTFFSKSLLVDSSFEMTGLDIHQVKCLGSNVLDYIYLNGIVRSCFKVACTEFLSIIFKDGVMG